MSQYCLDAADGNAMTLAELQSIPYQQRDDVQLSLVPAVQTFHTAWPIIQLANLLSDDPHGDLTEPDKVQKHRILIWRNEIKINYESLTVFEDQMFLLLQENSLLTTLELLVVEYEDCVIKHFTNTLSKWLSQKILIKTT